MIEKYIIVSEVVASTLADKVNVMIKKGYELYGSGYASTNSLFQPMVKHYKRQQYGLGPGR